MSQPLQYNPPPDQPEQLLSPHFRLSEFTVSQAAIRLGISNRPSVVHIGYLRRVANALETVRSTLGNRSIHITSGYRCAQLNSAVGSNANSAHVRGCAVDFVCPAFGTPRQICAAIQRAGIEFDQLIDETGWVHLGLALPGELSRQQPLTAIFTPGQPTRYRAGIGS